MVLGFIKKIKKDYPGLITGYEKRLREKGVEKSSASKAASKALKEKIAGWEKLNPIQSAIEGKTKYTDKNLPVWLPKEHRTSYKHATGQAKERNVEEQVRVYYDLVSEGKVGNIDVPNLRKRIRAGTATPIQKRIYGDVWFALTKPDSLKIFAKYGGYGNLMKMWKKNSEKIRRDEVLKKHKPSKSIDLYHLQGWGSENGNIGETVVVHERVLQNASLINGRGAPQPHIVMAPTGDYKGAMVVGQNIKATQDANIDLMTALDNAIKDNPELEKAISRKGSRVRKDVQNWMETLRNTPLTSSAGQAAITSGDWPSRAFQNIAKALNNKISSPQEAQRAFKQAVSGDSTKNMTVPPGLHSPKNSDFHNNMSVLEKETGGDNLTLAYATDFKGDEKTHAGKLDEKDPLTRLTYRQSIRIRDAFHNYRMENINTADYLKIVSQNMPSLDSDTDIVDYGKIYEMTMVALEAHELKGENAHLKKTREHITGNQYSESTANRSQYRDQAIDTSKPSGVKIQEAYIKRKNSLDEISAELQVIMRYLGQGEDGVQLDDAIFNSGEGNEKVTGMVSEIIQQVQSGIINIGDALISLKGLPFGRERKDDHLLNDALKEGTGLNSTNRSMLERLSDRVHQQRKKAEGKTTNRAYLKRAILDFKKLALTYKLSGMVQGEATGGRTISNQDFEVMLRALWGTQEASQVRMQSLVQRIETLRTVNNIDWRLRSSGTFKRFGDHRLSKKLRTEMHTHFHKKLLGRLKPTLSKKFAGGIEPKEVIAPDGSLTSRKSTSPQTYMKALTGLAADIRAKNRLDLDSKEVREGLDKDTITQARNSYLLLDKLFGEGEVKLEGDKSWTPPYISLNQATNTFMASPKTQEDLKEWNKTYTAGMNFLNDDGMKYALGMALRQIGIAKSRQQQYIYDSYVSLYNAAADEVIAAVENEGIK